ncbi:F390 synthetase-related protein [Pectobacterium brasiliense]|uniref:F390 synthetase-related protein n=1 Tax=Pectobacterium brasiliense TaxID=180957 RepID=UPI00057C930C|nr:F390 synthetase-related protein [Pectobacterium brasiliense]KHT15423.1 coenzyme F390 synthetase [Pectobacterium brasiliense]
MIPLMTLWHYFRARRLTFSTRQALERHQQRQLSRFARRVLARSPYFRPYCQLPMTSWPMMDKAVMMAEFERMNTAGLKRDELLACARRSEEDRDFTPDVSGFSVGLSSGTSGQRGLFVVSPREQQVWAGGMLAKMLPDGLRAGERVALFLRADNNLYHSVDNRWLSLSFYDLFAPFSEHVSRLEAWSPSIIVAPAQVLRELALAVQRGELRLTVKKVISVAEVLEPQDKQLLQQIFGQVGEVYQATEGFLASTCEHGTLHLNEEFIHIEPQWLDDERFTPIITDFTRSTQPIVRYRLDDVLVKQKTPCACGRVTMAIARIEGRSDDSLRLPDSNGEPQTVFADLCSRIIANALPLHADYRLVQQGDAMLHLSAACSLLELEACRDSLSQQFALQGIDVSRLRWQLSAGEIAPEFTQKRRRITRLKESA